MITTLVDKWEGNKKCRIDVDFDSRKIEFYTPYNPVFVERIRTVPYAKWDRNARKWVCKVESSSVLDALASVFEFFSPQNVAVIVDGFRRVFNISGGDVDTIKLQYPAGKKLYGFQEQGVKWLIQHKKVLLADEMGLGKTIQVIVALNTLEHMGKQVYPVVVVCPAVVKYNWANEFRNWVMSPKAIQVVNGRKAIIEYNNDVVIINYDVLASNISKIVERVKPKTLILDESHYIKNKNAKRTEAVYELVEACDFKRIIALSGTPMLNRPVELWTTIELLAPTMFKDFWHFAHKYCNPQHNGFGWVFGASRVDELGRLLRKSFMLRREKKDVLSELPDKIRTIVFAEGSVRRDLEQKATEIYKQMVEVLSMVNSSLFDVLNENGSLKIEAMNALQELRKRFNKILMDNIGVIEEYRQEAAKSKLPFIFEFIDNCINQCEKIVVFVHHREIYEAIIEKFKDKAVGIRGGDSNEHRVDAIKRFQEGDAQVFVGSMRASGQGITLNAASKVLFAEYDWTPAVMLQAEDRLHRIGQKDTVYSYWVVLKDTIDESFVRLILDKIILMNRLFDTDVFGEALLVSESAIDIG